MQNTLINHRYSRTDHIPELKIKQLQYEINSWKRLLDFIMEENIHLKNRLSEILKDRFDKYLLEEVDGFQTRFIRKDNLIALLRNEITEVDKLLHQEMFLEGTLLKNAEIKVKRLHKNINNAEKQFGRLKSDFHRFLSHNIL
jgi:regulator of replication initiation timing